MGSPLQTPHRRRRRLLRRRHAAAAAAPPPRRLLEILPPRPLRSEGGDPGVPQGVGKGVEAHVAKLEAEIGDIQNLLVARTLRLKKLGIPCKHRKLILKYTQKYRLGLWRPGLNHKSCSDVNFGG
uniref:Small ribosomal subunit protein mS41 SAM domain-containing protein n=1 Tax=Ananas comosus var. bracteatus TaxID=296719 RepID=A0A6V7QAD5_ANACO|nr:unnamed protein product [Ananas comosus var. bracteatus]